MPTVLRGDGVVAFCCAVPPRGRVLVFFFKASLLFAPVSALIDLKLTSIIDWPSHPISSSGNKQGNSSGRPADGRKFRETRAGMTRFGPFFRSRQKPELSSTPVDKRLRRRQGLFHRLTKRNNDRI